MASNRKKKNSRRPRIGEAYEKIIEGVMGTFEDGPSSVQHNAKVRGIRSGRERQVDVLCSGNIFGEPVNIAVECKDRGRPVGIGAVDEFIGKVLDLPVDYGILYSASGFDAGAKERARAHSHPKIILREYSSVAKMSVAESIVEFYAEFASLASCRCPNCEAPILLGDPEYADNVGEQCPRCGAIIGICASCEEVKVINKDGRTGEFPCDCYPGVFTVTQSGGVVRVASRRGDPDWGHGGLAWTP